MLFNETGGDPFGFSLRWSSGAAGARRTVRCEKTRNSKTTNRHVLAIKRARPIHPQQKVAFMARELVAHNRPTFDQLHPNVYKAAVALVAWFALAAWILFDRENDIGLPLAMVSTLLLVAVVLPWSLSLVWQKYEMADRRHPERISYRDWKIGDFAVWGSKLRGTQAAIDMLLPLAAVAFGLTALGIVFVICASFAK
jgi:hypothetical protein